ncbi:MAG TPA: nucleotidyltransferase family protein [Candidatus Tripitaka californicus]|uniref:nucleotidyltransferase family protein n=1 Tax=Candidatus Tripitaka californicus TaxID=3367616 RepID=UPI00402597E4
MLTKETLLEVLRRELPYLKSAFSVKRIGIFGSFAKGIQKEDSDVDVLIEFEKPIGLNFIELAEYIEKCLGRKVDIVTSGGLQGIRLKQVAKDIEKSVLYV